MPVSASLHAIGLLGASYTMVIDIPFETRDALFFGFFYTSLGYWIASSDWQPIPSTVHSISVPPYCLAFFISENDTSLAMFLPVRRLARESIRRVIRLVLPSSRSRCFSFFSYGRILDALRQCRHGRNTLSASMSSILRYCTS